MPSTGFAAGLTRSRAKSHYARKELRMEDLRAQALRIQKAKGGFGFGDLLKPFKSVARGALEVLDLPRKAVFELAIQPALGDESVKTGADLAKKIGVKGFGGKALGFGLDVAADPLTYVTFGAGSIGKQAAKEATFEVLAKRALGGAAHESFDDVVRRAGFQSVEDAVTKSEAIRDLGQRVLGKVDLPTKGAGGVRGKAHKAIYGKELDAAEQVARSRPTRMSDVYKRLSDEEMAALPASLQGGIRLRVPFTGNRIAGTRARGGSTRLETTLVSGKKTSVVSNPIARKVLDRPGFQSLANAVTSGRMAERGGIEGWLYKRGRVLARGEAAKLKAVVDTPTGLLNKMKHAFRDDDVTLANAVFRRPTFDINTVQDPAKRQVIEELWALSDDTGRKIQQLRDDGTGFIEGHDIRTLSDEARMKLYPRVEGQPAGARASERVSKKRQLTGTFDEDNATLSSELGVSSYFESDPYKAVAKYFGDAQKELHDVTLKEYLTNTQVLRDSLNVVDGDVGRVPIADLKRAGFGRKKGTASKDVFNEARHAAWVGTDERLAKLSPEVRAALEDHAQKVRDKTLQTKVPLKVGQKGAKKSATIRLPAREALKLEAATSQAHMDTVLQWKDQAKARVDDFLARRSEVVNNLDSMREEIGALEAQKALGTITKQGRDRLKGLKVEAKDLEKALGDRSKLTASTKKALAKLERNTELAEKQSEVVLKRTTRLKNVEMGMDPSGRHWPAPPVKGGRKELPEGWTVLRGTSLGILEGKAAPIEVAEELYSVLRPQNIGPLLGEWDKFLNMFRRWVTLPYPGFHMRNLMGGWFNNYIGGAGIRHHAIGEKLRRYIHDVNAGKAVPDFDVLPGYTASKLKELVDHDPFFNPVFGSEVAETLGTAQKLTRAGEAVAKHGGRASNLIESHLRLSALVAGLEQTGSVEAGRLFAITRHGDYSDLTHVERNFMRRIMPFYKWSRMNIPLQLQTMVNDPSRILRVTRFQSNVLGDPELEEKLRAEGKLPKTVELGGGFITGGPLASIFGGSEEEPLSVSAQLPFFDINSFFPEGLSPGSLAKGVLSQTAPPIKALTEAAFGENSFTGQELREMQPARGPIARGIGAFLESNPTTKKFTARTKSGELRVDGRVLNVLSSLPTSRWSGAVDQLLGVFGGSETSREGLTSTLFGIRPYQLTENRQQGQLYNAQETVDRAIKELYRLGYGEDFRATAPKKSRKRKGRAYRFS